MNTQTKMSANRMETPLKVDSDGSIVTAKRV